MRHRATLVAVFVLAIFAVAGWQVRTHQWSPLGSPSDHGPLGDYRVDGGFGMFPPQGVKNWWGTFGGLPLCATRPITITKIDPHWLVVPLDFNFVVRNVFDYDDEVNRTLPIDSAYGRAPEFDEPYTNQQPLYGETATDPAHANVQVGCNTPFQKGPRYTELLVAVLADSRGADLHSLTIHYRSTGHTYTAEVTGWEMLSCGNRVVNDACDGYLQPND